MTEIHNLEFTEQTTPSNPASGNRKIYPKSDGWYELDSAGTETQLGGGSVDASAVSYTPTTLADWDGSSDPGNADDAFDQLAERVTDLEGAGTSYNVASSSYTPSLISSNSTSYVDADATNLNLSFTPNNASATVIAIFTFSCSKTTNGTASFQLEMDGTTAGGGEVTTTLTTGNTPASVMGVWTGVSASAHAIRLQLKSSNSNNANILNAAVSMLAWEL